MSDRTIDIRDAGNQLSHLVARVKQGERILIVQAGKPVAELRPPRNVKTADPLLRLDEYSYDGPLGPVADEDIDCTV